MERRWHLAEVDPEAEGRLAATLQVSPLTARLLRNRGLREPEAASAFLEASLARHLHSPLLLRDMAKAVDRLERAITCGERIVVYGDYDVDGVSGAAEIILFLRELGVSADLYVPHRLREGYGLHAAAVRALAAGGARLLIAVDCGGAAEREIRLASELGVDVIVCDHHVAPPTRPPAVAVLNPRQPGCAFPFKGLSGAGVAFYLLAGLRMRLRERGRGALPDLRRYLDLVALGTVADMVPLREENRVLVKYGLRELGRSSRPGMVALREAAAVRVPTATAVAFRLGPRINAGGRLADARRTVEMLTTRDLDAARLIAAELERGNAERQEIEAAILAQALPQVEAMARAGERRSIVVWSRGWHPGVVGIVAARLVERFHRPALVIAIDGETARGSGRSIPGVHLYDALSECAELLASFGGHDHAAGFSLEAGKLEALREGVERAVRARTTPAHFVPQVDVDAELPLDLLEPTLLGELARLQPCGPGNHAPLFLARRVRVGSARQVGRGYLQLALRQGRWAFPAMLFRAPQGMPAEGEHIDVLYSPELDQWEGQERIRLVIKDFRRLPA